MAFDFLKGAGDLVSGAAGIASLFGSKKEPGASKSMEAALNEAIKMAKAAADPNSKAFKNLVALEEESGRLAAVKQIQEYLTQAQRSKARGGFGGAFNPERRDESIMKALARSFMEAKDQARNTARNTLLASAGSLTGSGGALSPVANIQNTVNQANDKRRADLGQALGAGISSFGGILDSWTQDSPVPKPGETQIALG